MFVSIEAALVLISLRAFFSSTYILILFFSLLHSHLVSLLYFILHGEGEGVRFEHVYGWDRLFAFFGNWGVKGSPVEEMGTGGVGTGRTWGSEKLGFRI